MEHNCAAIFSTSAALITDTATSLGNELRAFTIVACKNALANTCGELAPTVAAKSRTVAALTPIPAILSLRVLTSGV